LTIFKQPLNWLLNVLIILAPVICTWLLVTFHLHSALSLNAPFNSDEVYYWRHVATFSQTGLQGGYYTYNEWPAVADFSRFGAWGPVFALVYGSAAKILGWQYSTGMIFNLGAIGLASILFLTLVKLSLRDRLMFLLTIVLFYPLLLHIPSIVSETLNQSLAIVLGGLFYVQVQGKASRSVRIILFLLIGFAALLRATWAILYIPFYLAEIERKNPYMLLLGLLKAGVLILLSKLINSYWGLAPENPMRFTAPPFSLNITIGNLVFFQIIALVIVYTFIALSKASSRGYKLEFYSVMKSFPETFVIIITLMVALIAHALFYTIAEWYSFRLLSPFLLFVVVIIIAMRRVRIVLALMASALIFLPAFLSSYSYWRAGNFSVDVDAIEVFGVAVKDVIVYDNQTSNGWCNTLLTSSTIGYRTEFLGLPPQIGFSVVFSPNLMATIPPKSRYLLLDQLTLDKLKEKLHIRLLTHTNIGNLYLNLDSDCNNGTRG